MNPRMIVPLLLLPLALRAQPDPLVIQNTRESYPIHGFVAYLIDSVGLEADDVTNHTYLNAVDPEVLSNDKVFLWMVLKLRNETAKNQFVVTLDQWNLADIYIKAKRGWTTFHTGTNVPVQSRPISIHRLLSFPVEIPPGEEVLILARVKATDPLMQYYAKIYAFPSKGEVDESGHAYSKYLGNQLTVTFVLGVVVVLFFYNLSLFYFDKQKNSLILALYFIALAMTIANIHGIATNFLLTSVTAYEMHLAMHLAHLTPIIIAAFLIAFFRWRKKDWEFYLLLAFIGFMLISWLLSSLTQTSMFYFIRRYAENTTYFLVLLSAILKRKPGGWIIALAIMAGTVPAYYATVKAVFYENVRFTETDLPYLVGIMIQVAIFSIAATYRVRSLQQGVKKINEEKRLLIANQNMHLKTLVEEKTSQLTAALDTLKNQKLELENANQALEKNASELADKAASIDKLNRNLETLVNERTSALQRTMKDLDTFLYRTSHDLRRPLMTILGLTNLIEREQEKERVGQLTKLVRHTVGGLDQMLKKLIAISLCFQPDLETTSLDLSATVEKAIVDFEREKSNGGRIHFFRLSQGHPIASNEYLIQMMIQSLLENAFMYGGPHVEVEVKLESKGGHPVVTVTDNGPGIDPAYVPMIFEMFTRSNERSSGNGLGLYLVNVAAAKLGGRVSLTNKNGSGTVVELHF